MDIDLTGKKVAFIVDNYFEQAELEEPRDSLRDMGAEVVILSVKEPDLQAFQHVDKGDIFSADMLLSDAVSGDYDALLLPGGVINADSLRMVAQAQDWTVEFLDLGKPVAAICHAPWLLVSADAVEGRRLTSYPTLQDDIRNAGGEWVDQPVVVSGNLITSRRPDDIPQFVEALSRQLHSESSGSLNDNIENSLPPSDDSSLPAYPDSSDIEKSSRLRSMGYEENRDELSSADRDDILADDDESDPDQLRLRSGVVGDERDDTQ